MIFGRLITKPIRRLKCTILELIIAIIGTMTTIIDAVLIIRSTFHRFHSTIHSISAIHTKEKSNVLPTPSIPLLQFETLFLSI